MPTRQYTEEYPQWGWVCPTCGYSTQDSPKRHARKCRGLKQRQEVRKLTEPYLVVVVVTVPVMADSPEPREGGSPYDHDTAYRNAATTQARSALKNAGVDIDKAQGKFSIAMHSVKIEFTAKASERSGFR